MAKSVCDDDEILVREIDSLWALSDVIIFSLTCSFFFSLRMMTNLDFERLCLGILIEQECSELVNMRDDNACVGDNMKGISLLCK